MQHRWGAVLGLSLLSTACTMALPVSNTYAPQQAQVQLATNAEASFQCALQKFTAQGWGQVTDRDPALYRFQGQVNGIVLMTVQVDPADQGAVVDIHGKLVPNKIVQGEFDEVTTYATRVKECTS